MRVLSCARRDPVHRLAFSADGRFLAANQGTMYHRGIEVFDFAEPDSPTKVLEVQAAESFFKFLPDRPILAVADGNFIRGFSVAGQIPTHFKLIPDVIFPNGSFDITPDGCRLLVSEKIPPTFAGKATYQSWWIDRKDQTQREWTRELVWGRDTLDDAIVLVGDGMFVTCERELNIQRNAYDFFLIVCEIPSGHKRVVLSHRAEQEVQQVIASVCSGRVVVRSHDLIAVWSNVTDAERLEESILSGRFTFIAFHPSGRQLAASSEDGTVSLLDADSLAPVKAYAWTVGALHSVAFSADGTLGAAGSADGRIVVWDAEP